MFTGRVPLVWPGGVYNNNGISIGAIPRASNVAFKADPFNQYSAADFGGTVSTPSGQVDLIAKDFRMNKVVRTSMAIDKNLGSKLAYLPVTSINNTESMVIWQKNSPILINEWQLPYLLYTTVKAVILTATC